MILAIVGTRTGREEVLRYEVRARIRLELDGAASDGFEIVTGCCSSGVDHFVRVNCGARFILHVVHAAWDIGPQAGPDRNRVIARVADRCLAFPERDEPKRGSGTWDCVRAFEALGKPVEVFGEWRRLGQWRLP